MQKRRSPISALTLFDEVPIGRLLTLLSHGRFVEIEAGALGLSPPEVEQTVAVPLEADLLDGVPWLDVMSSESTLMLPSLAPIFETGTDMMRVRHTMQERFTQPPALPNTRGT